MKTDAFRRALTHRSSADNKAYVFNLVRSFDNENFIINLLQSDPKVRLAHAAIRAFNVELDRVRASVSNEDLARIRIQYFRDALNSVLPSSGSGQSKLQSSSVSKSEAQTLPVFDVLSETFDTFDHVDFSLLHSLINAREAYLTYPSFSSLSDLSQFAIAPHYPLIQIHHALLSPSSSNSQVNIRPIAMAVGLSILLRAVPVHAASRLSYMPRTNITTPSTLLSWNEQSKEVFRNVAMTARHAVKQTDIQTIPRKQRPAFWPLILANMFLERLRRADDNPFDERLIAGSRTTWHLAVQLRLLRARMFGR